MKSKLLLALLCLCGACFAQTYTYSTLVTFPAIDAGPSLPSNLIIDAQGNLYGGSELGGTYGNGTVYEVSPKGVVTVLHSFASSKVDGWWSFGTLARDSGGNLYGSTEYGGSATTCFNLGCGTIFKVTAAGKESVLYRFTNGSDGAFPVAGLARDTAGNLFGVSYTSSNETVAFKLTPHGVFTPLYTFNVDLHGDYQLIRNQAGNIFGNLYASDTTGNGSVFELTPQGVETSLYTFNGSVDGGDPTGKLTQDAKGNLYGTAVLFGAHGGGVVFKIDASGIYSVLYSFCQLASCADGTVPASWLTLDSAGNLYGVTTSGGSTNNGVFYKIAPNGTETVLYNFAADQNPLNQETGLVMDKAGNFYAATYSGGDGAGSIYKLTKH